MPRFRTPTPRLVVAITGASGPQLGIHLLRVLRRLGWLETHLVMSAAAHRTLRIEADMQAADVEALADHVHGRRDIAASIASGSFETLGMIVAPCSMGTLGRIAQGYSDDLITRAADVVLKERRTLVVVPRETPLNLIHIRNMAALTEAGGIVLPATPGFYHRPSTIEDLLDHLAGRILDQFSIEHDLYRPWSGPRVEEEV